MGTNTEGTPMTFQTPDLRAYLRVEAPRTPYLTMSDNHFHAREALVVCEDGAACLALNDHNTNSRAEFRAKADGSPGLLFFDPNGKTRVELDLKANHSAALVLRDPPLMRG